VKVVTETSAVPFSAAMEPVPRRTVQPAGTENVKPNP
jgi:hypothetical protein